MHLLQPHVKHCIFARLVNQRLQFLADLRDFLLDACGIDTSVQNQVLQGLPSELATDRVETAKHDGLRRIVDEHVDTRG
jgi:hypothetical protein